MNIVHKNGIKMACEWICRRFYKEHFNAKSYETLTFEYLFGEGPNDSIIDKFDNSRDFLDLFDVNKTGQDSIPEKCLSHFSNHKYGTKSDTNVDYSIVDRFWKLLGRDILDCFLKRQELDDTKEWLNSEIIDSFGGVFKLTVWEDIIRDDEHFDNEWTHINRKRKVFNDKYLMKITNKDAINILLKIIGPLKIGIMLYVKENCYNSFKNCGTEDMLLLDRLIIAHSYSLFPIYYIRAGPSNMFTDKKIINKTEIPASDYSVLPFGVELHHINKFIELCPSAIVISVVNTSMEQSDGTIRGTHWVMLAFNRDNNQQKVCSLICSMGNNFNCFNDKTLVVNIKKFNFDTRHNSCRIQTDGHSCGVYSILAMMYYSMDCDIRNTVNNIKELKNRTFRGNVDHEDMFEIIRNLIGVYGDNIRYRTIIDDLEKNVNKKCIIADKIGNTKIIHNIDNPTITNML